MSAPPLGQGGPPYGQSRKDDNNKSEHMDVDNPEEDEKVKALDDDDIAVIKAYVRTTSFALLPALL